LYSVVPNPNAANFYFLQKFLNVQRLFSLNFSVFRQFFINVQGFPAKLFFCFRSFFKKFKASATFSFPTTFSKFSNLSLHDQILNQI